MTRKWPLSRVFGYVAALSLDLGAGAGAAAQTADVTVFAGPAWTRMVPYDSPEASADFDHIEGNVFGGRVRVGLRPGLSLVGEVSRVPRGGYASFRQSYGYFAEYVQASTRVELSRRGGPMTLYLSLGPTVGVRTLWQNTYILDGERVPPVPGFGEMEKVEVGLLLSAGLRSSGRLLGCAEIQLSHGLSRLHERGSPGTFHDPHVHDFRARSLSIAGVVGVGLVLKR